MNDESEDELAWRETYFILFDHAARPTLTQVEAALTRANRRLKFDTLAADDDGLFESALVQAPEDNAALEISYEEGDAVVEQSVEIAKQLRKRIDTDQLARLLKADARLDIMHFERLHEDEPFYSDEPDDEFTEMLDPASLITVVDALAKLTDGMAIDPASGDLLL
jgi:hypothetical protein